MNSSLQNVVDKNEAAIREYQNLPAAIATDMKKYLETQKQSLAGGSVTPRDFINNLRTKAAEVSIRIQSMASNNVSLLKDKYNVLQNGSAYDVGDAIDFMTKTQFSSMEYLSLGHIADKQFHIIWEQYRTEIQNVLKK
jgi:hypothetical protein